MSRRVAIVGAGPAERYAAQALARAAGAPAIDVIDRAPAPFGLVRYGIASDRHGAKAVARQFARVFARGRARFIGGATLGPDVTLHDLRARYDAVLLATGAEADRSLDIPAADLPGVLSGDAVARALNDDPQAKVLPDLGGRPVILGAGDVALDIARLLLSDAAGLEGGDLSPTATDRLLEARPQDLTLVARRRTHWLRPPLRWRRSSLACRTSRGRRDLLCRHRPATGPLGRRPTPPNGPPPLRPASGASCAAFPISKQRRKEIDDDRPRPLRNRDRDRRDGGR